MATITLVANTNLSALSPAAGDTIQLAGFALNIDASPVNAFIIASNNAASRVTVAAGTWTISATFSFTVVPSASFFTVAAGQSVTINASSYTSTAAYSLALFTVTGGTLVITAGASATLFVNVAFNFILLAQSGGSFNFTGSVTTTANVTLINCTGGTCTGNGNLVMNGVGGSMLASGSGVINWTGNYAGGSSVSSNALCANGGTSVITVTGTWIQTGGGNNGAVMILNGSNGGGTINLNGKFVSKNGAVTIQSSNVGTINWLSQSLTVSSGEEIVAQMMLGTLNLSNLIISNSGSIAINRQISGAIVTTGASITNSATGQSAICGASITTANTPSTVSYMPTVGQVQAGVVFGYVGSTITGTAATIDINALTTSLGGSLTTTIGSLITTSQGAITTAVSSATTTLANDVTAATTTLANDVTAATNTLAADITATQTALSTAIVSSQGVLAADITAAQNLLAGDITASQTALSASFATALLGITVAHLGDDVINALKAALAQVPIGVTGPVLYRAGKHPLVTLTAGDSYTGDRAIELQLDGSTLQDLSSAKVWLVCEPDGAKHQILISGEITVATGTTRTVRFEPATSDTAKLVPSVGGECFVSIAVGSDVITPEDGRCCLDVDTGKRPCAEVCA